MTEELKTCPFCGGVPVLTHTDAFHETMASGYIETWIECEHCGCTMDSCLSDEEAITAWNNRQESDELCPQFGVIGSVCCQPEILCNQYKFCKRARELQKEPPELSEWVKEKINAEISVLKTPIKHTLGISLSSIDRCKKESETIIRVLEWVLSLRRGDE